MRRATVRGVGHFFAVQQRAHHAHVFAHRLGAGGAQPQHTHGGVARTEDGIRAARGQRVDCGDAVGRLGREAHAAHGDTGADLDGLGFHRYRSHGGEQVRAQQWAVGHPATREAEPFAVLGEIKGRDVADADTEFHNRNLLI